MNNLKFIVHNNKVKTVYSNTQDKIVVYDRNNESGISEVNKNEVRNIIDTSSFSFRTDCVDFLKFIKVKLHKIANKTVEEVPLDLAIYDVITQAMFNKDIVDCDDFDECYIRACCEEAIKFLGKTMTDERFTIIRLYVIEQIIQKHFCHIYNATWLNAKQQNSNLDLNTEPQIAVIC